MYLDWCGFGLLNSIRLYIHEKGLENIKLIENCEYKELLNYYFRSKVFISPSLYEGFGMPIIEAEAAGLTIVQIFLCLGSGKQ